MQATIDEIHVDFDQKWQDDESRAQMSESLATLLEKSNELGITLQTSEGGHTIDQLFHRMDVNAEDERRRHEAEDEKHSIQRQQQEARVQKKFHCDGIRKNLEFKKYCLGLHGMPGNDNVDAGDEFSNSSQSTRAQLTRIGQLKSQFEIQAQLKQINQDFDRKLLNAINRAQMYTQLTELLHKTAELGVALQTPDGGHSIDQLLSRIMQVDLDHATEQFDQNLDDGEKRAQMRTALVSLQNRSNELGVALMTTDGGYTITDLLERMARFRLQQIKDMEPSMFPPSIVHELSLLCGDLGHQAPDEVQSIEQFRAYINDLLDGHDESSQSCEDQHVDKHSCIQKVQRVLTPFMYVPLLLAADALAWTEDEQKKSEIK